MNTVPLAQPSAQQGTLVLHRADRFHRRLLGLHAWPVLGEQEGLVLAPCRAIHTFFLNRPIDVVFLDDEGRECRRIEAMTPNRMAYAKDACMVVELRAGYCARHPGYLEDIRAALQPAVFSHTVRNTLT